MIRVLRGLLGALLLLGAAAARVAHADGLDEPALPTLSQRYELDLDFDPGTHQVTGREHIRFTNESTRATSELYFHLYLNAFADAKSVFAREGGLELRGAHATERGQIEVIELHAGDGSDLLRGAEHELEPHDRTQLRVHLPTPLAPGATLELELRFRARLPSLATRAGFAGDFFMFAQFFPKLARLEHDGRWASFPYHGLGEFYADFADYTLRVRAPARFVIASGGAHESVTQGSITQHTFRSRAVQDVAFAAFPRFELHELQAGAVRIRFYSPPGYGAAVDRQLYVIRAGLAHYGRLFGPYPYDTLTVILPPPEAYGARGMEYPALFVSDGPWWAMPAALPDPLQDLVAAHELAHQWFSVMLASHEVEAPALDEGLAEWCTLDLVRALYARSPLLAALGVPPTLTMDVVRAFDPEDHEAVPSSLLPAYRYRRDELAAAVYLRPTLVLDAVEHAHGRRALELALGRYARANRFAHPGFAELFAAFDSVLGPGFSERTLRPALEGRKPAALVRSPASAPATTRARLAAKMLLAAQALLHGLGP